MSYVRRRIGVSKVIRLGNGLGAYIPKSVRKNYKIEKGDIFEWYPPDTEFPEDAFEHVIAVLVVRVK